MASVAGELAALESLMNEFYDSSSSNLRKREIESILQNFTELPTAWKASLYFISNSNNQYVLMYCLTQLETLITKKWIGLTNEDRAQIKGTLYHLVVTNHQTAPKFFRNKLVKLLVDIARLDWPHFYPEFFTNILQLIQTPGNTVLGLVFLQTASEELVCPWEDLSVARKDDLKRFFLLYIPEVFHILTNLLEAFIQNQRHNVTATPPPSPTHGQPNSTSSVHSGSLFNNVNDGACVLSTSSDPESNAICCAALQAIIHIFSWVPLDMVKVPSLVTNLFRVANIIPCSVSNGDHCVGTLALAALTEIMYKIFMPANCKEFLVNVVLQLVQLLRRLVEANDLDKTEAGYLEKMTEFLLQFVKSHLHRVEDSTEFSTLEFLSLLYKYTFRQRNLERYYRCLDIWHIFINSMHSKPEHLSRYSGALLAVASEVLKQSQFSKWKGLLDELDDEKQDADGHTELEHFMMKSMEILTEIAHFMPVDLYDIMSQMWDENCRVYLRLHEKIEVVGEYRRFNLEEHECLELHYILKDLSSLVRLIGSMDLHFYGQNLVPELREAECIARYVRDMSTYAAQHRFHHVHVSNSRLTSDFIEVHVQVLEALKPWCSWVSYLNGKSFLEQAFNNNVDNILNATVPIIVNKNEPMKLHLSAARLLVHFIRVVRPVNLWNKDPFIIFFKDLSIVFELNPEVQRLVFDAMYCCLLLPWRSTQSQMWEKRQEMFVSLMDMLTWDFKHKEFSSDLPLPVARQIILKTLKMLHFMVCDMKNEGAQTKRIISDAIQAHIQKTLSLFSLYAHLHDVCEAILDFFVAVFGTLQQQMGVTVIGNIVQNILVVFSRKPLMVSLCGSDDEEDGAGCRAVEKYLTLLQLVMAESGQAFNRFISSTTAFCLEHVYPIAEAPTPGIKLALFTVFHSILLNKWQYFYPCSLKRFGETEYVKNQQQFVAILQAYGRTLLEPDINIFKHNLSSLEQLNVKRNLYHKKLFVQMLWSNFLTALLNCLINKTHSLLDDDIYLAIFNMASVNFNSFHNGFLRRFLSSSEGLDDGQRNILRENCRLEKDAPSFIQNLQRLVNDLRCYRICNYSLPTASSAGTSSF
ncbi:exportin-6-B [Anabrus simplex]|uniref:exportin-6-B n=1 Tax=Anabrus simplex TaxID=316456 RepID=UPI0035A2CCDC